MSKLSRKLQRLATQGVPELELSQDIGPSEHGSTPDCAAVLDTLKQQLARVISKSSAHVPSSQRPSTGKLPFAEQMTPLGPQFVRCLSFERHHRTGRFPINCARDSCSSMLSLLALDPALSEVDMGRALYLDTETTGLSGGTGTLPFLVGMGGFDGSGTFAVEQLFLRRPGEEVPLLTRVLERLRGASALVTFNGKAFDIPLLRTRLVMNRMPAIDSVPHLDLLYLARRLHKARIGVCSLGAVEAHVLGFERADDVPSCEIASRYFHFLRTGDEGAMVGVVAHNVWDIVSMVALVGLYGAPLEGLPGEDLANAAKVVHRARCVDRAADIANAAVANGGGTRALRTRALLAKARGEKNVALADFEQIASEVDDPSVRLELAKLYEHHVKAFDKAIDMVDRGIAEDGPTALRRRDRLCRKTKRAASCASAEVLDQQEVLPFDGLDVSAS